MLISVNFKIYALNMFTSQKNDKSNKSILIIYKLQNFANQ